MFVGRKKRLGMTKFVCECVPPEDGGPGCLDDCINRYSIHYCIIFYWDYRCMYYECNVNIVLVANCAQIGDFKSRVLFKNLKCFMYVA